MAHYQHSMDEYIQRTPDYLKRLVERRKELLAPAVSVLNGNEWSELILLGSGSSYTAAVSARYFMQQMMGKTITLAYPNNVLHYERFFNHNAVAVGISQSGNSVAAIEAVCRMRACGYPTIALTSDPESSMAKAAGVLLDLGIGVESCGPKTAGYQATVLQLQLLALEYGYGCKRVSEAGYRRCLEDVTATIDNLSAVRVAVKDWYEQNRERMIGVQKISVVGYGCNYGTALEGSLKLIETVRCPAYGYEFEEYLHGPNDGIDRNSTIFLLQSPDQEGDRMDRFHQFAERITTEGILITSRDRQGNNVMRVPFADRGDFTVLEYVVPLQYLAFRVSWDRAVNLNEIRYPEYYTFMNCKTKL